MDLKNLVVFVYRNLHRRGVVYSLKSVKSGRVVDRRETIYLKNPVFKVSQAGRARVLRTKQKVVHAGVQGEVLSRRPSVKGLRKVAFTYNPYKYEHFVTSKGKSIFEAKYVVITPEGLFAYI